MFNELEIEAGPVAETRTFHEANLRVVESSDSKPERRSKVMQDIPALRATPTKKITRSQTSQTFPSCPALPAKGGKKKQKSANKCSTFDFLSLSISS